MVSGPDQHTWICSPGSPGSVPELINTESAKLKLENPQMFDIEHTLLADHKCSYLTYLLFNFTHANQPNTLTIIFRYSL